MPYKVLNIDMYIMYLDFGPAVLIFINRYRLISVEVCPIDPNTDIMT